MKKNLFTFLVFIMFVSVSSAYSSECCKNDIKKPDCNSCQKEINKINADCTKECDKCKTEDDEYCVYNQCFFDKRFRKLKQKLCLSAKQENMADNIYQIYKSDMECICNKYKNQKNLVLEMIECHNQCWKDEKNILKEIRNEAKERSMEFRNDLKEILCKSQIKEFNKYYRSQKKKMKRLVKYGAIYKLPCVNCEK